jgi:hypothetical protein
MLLIYNLSSGRERRWTQIAVRDGILRIYGETQTALAMEGTGNCQKIGKCDVVRVAVFVPTFRASKNADVMQLFWIRSKYTMADIWKQKTRFGTFEFKNLNMLFVHIFSFNFTSKWWQFYPPHYFPGKFSGCQKSLDFWNNRLPFMLAYCLVWELWDYFVLAKKSLFVTVW